jgi:hypothetical protein
MVGCWKTSREVRARPARRARETTWRLMIESPPRSKKLSCTPTRASPRTSAQMAARVRSVPVRAATYPSAAAVNSGAGRALRSSLPLAFNGRASSTTNAAGTMYSGSSPAVCSRTPATSRPPSPTR